MERIMSCIYTGLYVLFLCAFFLLALVSGREDLPPYARDPPLLRPVRRMAVFLYRRLRERREARRSRGKDLLVPGEESVRNDLQILYPSLKARRQEVIYQLGKIERLLLLCFAGILLAGLLHARSLFSGILQENGQVERAQVGGEDRILQVTALPPEKDSSGKSEETSLDKPPEEDLSGKTAETSQDRSPEKDPSGKTANTLQDKAPKESAEQSPSNQMEKPAEPSPEDAGADSAETSPEKDYGTYTVTVHARQYTRREAETRAQAILEQFPAALLGDNESADRIRAPLTMPSAAAAAPFSLSWESSRYAVMDTDGSIFNSEYGDSQEEEVELTAILTYADYHFQKKMSFTVCAPLRDEAEQLRGQIGSALQDAEKESAAEEIFTLPAAAGGRNLAWREQVEDVSAGVLVLAIVSCILAWYVMDYRLHERTRARSRQLAIDYPQLTSKFVLYLGAGMSVRNVFYTCAAQYRAKRAADRSAKGGGKPGSPAAGGIIPGSPVADGKSSRGGTGDFSPGGKDKGVRWLYEEILLVCNELDSGVPEAEAYMHFGRRCHLRQYTKLSSLLVQNLRRGNDTLLQVLQEEAQSSFEERKNLARELGEEAGTKLLLPMMIMLGITMLIIIVPAYFSFSI